MGKVCWDFPFLGTGSLSGSNDAAITMFKGSGVMDGLAREICQNSLDARSKDVPSSDPVKVHFKLFELDRNRYRVFDEFEEALNGAYAYWNNSPVRTKKIFDFLDTAKKYLTMEKIPVLVMSDYNTDGLMGVNAAPGERSYWELLVNTEGISIKQNKTSAGSFGIGKNAPFAYSGLSTVFYNTFARDGGRAFEGVTHLVTTQRELNGVMRPTHPSGKYLYLEDEFTGRPIYPTDDCDLAHIEEFNRSEPGTDVAVFGFKIEEYENWEEHVAVAVLKNFILALNDGKLEVEIESPSKRIVVSKATIENLLYQTLQNYPALKWTRQIYETVTKSEVKYATIAEKDDLSIYVRYDEGYSASLSRFRSSGMLINTTTESLPHYSVVIIVNDVNDATLSRTLREAEPPQHTEWKAKNITDNRTLHNLAAKYIRYISKAIQKVLDEFERAEITDRMDAGIGNYLPDASEGASEEGTDGLRTGVRVREIASYSGRVFYNKQYESAESQQGTDTQKTGFKAGKRKRKKRNSGKIQVVTPSGGKSTGVSTGAGKVRISTVNLVSHRIYYVAGNKYRMYVNSPKDYDRVFVQFFAGRDDDGQDPINVKNIKFADKPLTDVHSEKVGPFELKEGGNIMYVEFENSEIMAVIPMFTMEVIPDAKQGG